MDGVRIRPETDADHTAVAEVTAAAFGNEDGGAPRGGDPRFREAFMAVPLSAYDSKLRGRVSFAPPFV